MSTIDNRYAIVNPPGGAVVVGSSSIVAPSTGAGTPGPQGPKGDTGAQGPPGPGAIDVASMAPWSAKIYPAGTQVSHNGKAWLAVQTTHGHDTPGASSNIWHEMTLQAITKQMTDTFQAIDVDSVGVAADAGDRDQAYPHPVDGQAVFNMAARSIDVYNTADSSWTMVGPIPHAATVASLPGWTTKGSIIYVDDTDELYVLAPDPQVPNDLKWKPLISGGAAHNSGAVKTLGTKEIIAWLEYEDPNQQNPATRGVLIPAVGQNTPGVSGNLGVFAVAGDDYVGATDASFPNSALTKRWLSPRIASDKENSGGLLFGRESEGAGVLSVDIELEAMWDTLNNTSPLDELRQPIEFRMDIGDLIYTYPNGEAGGTANTTADPTQGRRMFSVSVMIPELMNRWMGIVPQLRVTKADGATHGLRISRLKAVMTWEPWPDIPALAAPVLVPAGRGYGLMPDGSEWEDGGSGVATIKVPATNPNWPGAAP